jgi:hypothetical protein
MFFATKIRFYTIKKNNQCQKTIIRDKIIEFIGDNATKRINFAGSHAHGLKKNEEGERGRIPCYFIQFYR